MGAFFYSRVYNGRICVNCVQTRLGLGNKINSKITTEDYLASTSSSFFSPSVASGADRGGAEHVGARAAQGRARAVPHQDGVQEVGEGARHHGRLQGRRPQDGLQGRRQRHQQARH